MNCLAVVDVKFDQLKQLIDESLVTEMWGYERYGVAITDAAARVLEMNSKVEQVRGAAAERLEKAGNIGALLRF